METVSIWQKRLLNAHEVFSARKWVRFIRANRFEIDSSNEKLFYSFSRWFRSRTTSVPEIPLASSCLQFFQWIRNVDNLKIEMCLFRLENRKIALNESIGRTNCELYTRISGTLHWFTLTAHTKIGQYASSIICKLKMHSDQSSIVWKYHYIHIYIRILIKLTSIKYSVWNMKLLQQLYTRFFSLSARFANMWAATCFYCVRLFFVFCLPLSRFIYIFSNSFAFSTMRE